MRWMELCRRGLLSQKMSPEEEEQNADSAKAARPKELDDGNEFDVFGPRKNCDVSKKVAQTRLALKWKIMDGQKSVKTRLVAKGYQGPDLLGGIMVTS